VGAGGFGGVTFAVFLLQPADNSNAPARLTNKTIGLSLFCMILSSSVRDILGFWKPQRSGEANERFPENETRSLDNRD
jgi:hypothetical protein